MEANMILEGLKYMVLGMTTVFLFLLLLIYMLKLQTLILNKFFTSQTGSMVSAQLSSRSDASGTKEDEVLIAVITAAITEFKKG